MKYGLILGLMCSVLAGCASPEFEQNAAENEVIQQTIASHTTYAPPSKVSFIDKPPMSVLPITEQLDRLWMKDYISVKASDMPFSMALKEVMNGVDIPMYFAEGVKPNMRVSLNFANTRENVLNLLSRESGYGIELKDNRLEVSKTITRVFSLNIPSGTVSGQLGSQGESEKDSVRVKGQYLNIQYKDMEVVNEVANSIKHLLGGEEEAKDAVFASTSMTTITVKATPDQMQDVEALVEHYQNELSKQVLLDIQVVEFRSNLGTERGIDWNIVRDTGDGLLQFFVPGTNTVSESAGYGLAFKGSGKWTGTETFIKVLEKQGSVSTQTPITARVINNQPAKITQQRIEPFIYEASSESSEGVVSASVTRKEEVEGVDMMVNAKITNEEVFLRISGQLQKIVERDTEKVQQIALGMLTRQKSEITFVNKLRYGQTFVIASVKQTSKTAEQTSNFWSTLFGGTGSSNDTVETLVLLTPRKVQ